MKKTNVLIYMYAIHNQKQRGMWWGKKLQLLLPSRLHLLLIRGRRMDRIEQWKKWWLERERKNVMCVCVWIWYNNSSLKPKWMHNIKGKLCWTSLQSYNINPIQYVNFDALLFVGWMNTFIQLLHHFFLPSFVFLQTKRTSLSKQSLLESIIRHIHKKKLIWGWMPLFTLHTKVYIFIRIFKQIASQVVPRRSTLD